MKSDYYQWHNQFEQLSKFFHNAYEAGFDPKNIERSTGLLDKNNKEIYEGDIVKLCDARNGDKQGRVYFANGAFFVEKIDSLFYGAKDGICGDYEVIGNIHEAQTNLQRERLE